MNNDDSEKLSNDINLFSDKDKIKAKLNEYNIRWLYHITPIENLENIAKMGAILSKNSLEDLGLYSKVKVGNDLSTSLDRYHGNWNKISLIFSISSYSIQRFLYNKHKYACIVINSEVACDNGVYFTDSNAASNGHLRDQGIKGLNHVDFKCVFMKESFSDEKWKKKSQAEVLVPDKILLQDIRAIIFCDEATRDLGMRYWGSGNQVEMRIDNNFEYRG